MGKNYYYLDEHEKQWHVGKSSYGWKFIFRAQPELDIYTSYDWLDFLRDGIDRRPDQRVFVDEYDNDVDLEYWEEFNYDQDSRLRIMNEKRAENDIGPFQELYDQIWHMKENNYDTRDYYRDNHGNIMTLGDFS